MVLDLVSGRADDHLSDKGTHLDFAKHIQKRVCISSPAMWMKEARDPFQRQTETATFVENVSDSFSAVTHSKETDGLDSDKLLWCLYNMPKLGGMYTLIKPAAVDST